MCYHYFSMKKQRKKSIWWMGQSHQSKQLQYNEIKTQVRLLAADQQHWDHLGVWEKCRFSDVTLDPCHQALCADKILKWFRTHDCTGVWEKCRLSDLTLDPCQQALCTDKILKWFRTKWHWRSTNPAPEPVRISSVLKVRLWSFRSDRISFNLNRNLNMGKYLK
jgi:hypothetical protein